jgi:uncharacterized protein YecE (DUF72 family)
MGGEIRIGTSGWTYRHWEGRFYPQGLPSKKWLEFYCHYFNTVELNSPFYRIPSRKVFESWSKRTLEGFLFAVKASRLITHKKRLRDVKEELEWFFLNAEGLGDKRGPILFQTPPSLKADVSLLEEFLKLLPPGLYAFEFRHGSWFQPSIYEVLKAFGATLCVADSPNFPRVKLILGDFLYLRLHGSLRLYSSLYTYEELREWASFIQEALDSGVRMIFCYFDNDYEAYAVRNALKLKELLGV